jgi:hypothetical protein
VTVVAFRHFAPLFLSGPGAAFGKRINLRRSGLKAKQQQLRVADSGFDLKTGYPSFGMPEIAGAQVDRSSTGHQQAALIAGPNEQKRRFERLPYVGREQDESRELRSPTNNLQIGQSATCQLDK